MTYNLASSEAEGSCLTCARSPELVTCPEFGCQTLLSRRTLEHVLLAVEAEDAGEDSIPGADLLQRYERGRVRAFVERAGGFLAFCPSPGCEWVVERRKAKVRGAESALKGKGSPKGESRLPLTALVTGPGPGC